MKLETKKILAREFIIFFITIIFVLCSFVATAIYNYRQSSNAGILAEMIRYKTAAADSLAKPYNTKMQNQQWFYDKNNEIVDLTSTEFNTPYKLWQRLDYLAGTDSIKIKLDSVWTPEIKALLVTIDFDRPEKITAFIHKNRITKADSLNLAQSAKLVTEIARTRSRQISYLDKVLVPRQQVDVSLWALLFLMLSLFVFRYLFYGIRWSVQILKQ